MGQYVSNVDFIEEGDNMQREIKNNYYNMIPNYTSNVTTHVPEFDFSYLSTDMSNHK